MLRLHLLGTGSPNPLPERQGSAVLLERDHEYLLFDAGRGVTTQLVRAGVAPHDLSAIFLTHHHYDHIGNLGDLLLTAWHGGSTHLPLIGPPGTEQIVQALFDQVYQREIAFSLALAHATATSKPDIRAVVPVTTVKRHHFW
jgi:ribonuclease BN (tRNA processing enzyme)